MTPRTRNAHRELSNFELSHGELCIASLFTGRLPSRSPTDWYIQPHTVFSWTNIYRSYDRDVPYNHENTRVYKTGRIQIERLPGCTDFRWSIFRLLVTSGGYHWRNMQTCSFEDPPDRHLVVVIESRTIGASGRYASNWNAFLSSVCVRITARKRSLQRLCFYTCLSVILFTGGGGSPGPQPMEGGGLLGGSPGPHPGGDWGSGWGGVSRPTPRGRLGVWPKGSPHLGGVQAQAGGMDPSMHWGRHPSPCRWLPLQALRMILECILVADCNQILNYSLALFEHFHHF